MTDLIEEYYCSREEALAGTDLNLLETKAWKN
jgi:hypothetical protein